MEFKGTQGTWYAHVGEYDGTHYYEVLVDKDDGETVKIYKEKRYGSYPVLEANAHLIAASPELLRSAIALLERIDTDWKHASFEEIEDMRNAVLTALTIQQ